MPRAPALLLLTLIGAGALILSVSLGSSGDDPVALWGRALAGEDPVARAILLDLRLPRALAAFATGAVLALAGVLMQVLLRNPLADPYVLGVSGGAAVAAVGAMLLGLGGLWVDLGAAGGALGAMLLVFALAHGPGGWTPTRLLLTGVVVAAGCSAAISVMLATAGEAPVRGMLAWLMGDLSYSGMPWSALVVLALALPACLALARPLDVLSRGDLQAAVLGLPVREVRLALYFGGSVLTAVAVTTAGSIGFVGLVTPHLVRLALGSSHRVVVPASALLGGTLLVLADLAARTVVAPRQLPVGALTALIGVPLFLVLMRRERRIG
ncbi:MAG: ABC transporter permease [Gammaproteobacteria bacterium SG8_30]|jgi:iron complex transport system permease protein|nr:MAG: ABC transporter permease [Gammaproteobacteria bacterium SG8_30]